MAEKLYDVYHQEIKLTDEQQACLKYSGDRTLMVKGFAGAGKSLVLMELARRLIDKYGKGSRNKVAIFTYQNTLVSTTMEYLKINKTDEEGVLVTTFSSHIKGIYDLLERFGAAPKRNFFIDKKKRINIVTSAIRLHQTKYGNHRFHNIDPEFWIEEFTWMKDMNIWTDDKDRYLDIPRRGRGGNIRMSAADRVTAYELFTCYCECLKQSKLGDWEDQSLFLIRHPDYIPDSMKFENILVDEAQDLSLAQMKVIMMLQTHSMVVALDMNQRIFNKHWTPRQLGIDTTTKKLTKSMRTTKKIDALAESIRCKNDEFLSEDDKSLRAIPDNDGDRLPELVHLEDAAAERKYVVNLVKQYLNSNNKLTIGIIAAKNRQMKIYADWLASENINHEHVKRDATFSIAKPGVKIASAHGAKGLEFDIVIIPMFAEGNFPYAYHPEDEESYKQFIIKSRNLVYVSMTRARLHLVITFYGNKGSRFIGEMDPELYTLIGEKPVIKEYKFTPKVSTEQDSPISNSTKSEETSAKTGKIKKNKPIAKESSTSSPNAQRDVPPGTQKTSGGELLTFLQSKGVEVVDKRAKGGALWVIGDNSIFTILQDSTKQFGALWIPKKEGSIATGFRPGWYTKSEK